MFDHIRDDIQLQDSDIIELIELDTIGSPSSFTSSPVRFITSPNTLQHERVQIPRAPSFGLNRILKIWSILVNGPKEIRDTPPEFHRRWKAIRVLDDISMKFQHRFVNRKVKFLLLAVYCCIWFAFCIILLYPTFIAIPYVQKDGIKREVNSISCNGQWNWLGKNNKCGLNAINCNEFENEDVIIKCPALCNHSGRIFSEVTVGDKIVKYRRYIIGGGRIEELESENLTYPFRADTFPCIGAIHAGLISPIYGGCIQLSMSGFQTGFPSTKGHYGTGESISFDSIFPSSFKFKKFSGAIHGCHDPRVLFTITNIMFSLPIFYLYESIIGYWVLVIAGYWTLLLAMDPPIIIDPNDRDSVYQLWSLGFERILPLCFILYVLWKVSVHTLSQAPPIIKVIFWFPLYWIGVLNNITFERLPLDRLRAEDLRKLTGGITVITILITIVFICAIIQAFHLWRAGNFNKYLKLYLGIAAGLTILGCMPGLNLRFHHYIVGILLVPACATCGVSAYLFQGILIGLIISGSTRWGFESIVESKNALSRGEAGLAAQPPIFYFKDSSPHVISWQLERNANQNKHLDGYSLLINDIESYIGSNTTIDLDILFKENNKLAEQLEKSKEANHTNFKLYLRLARRSINNERIIGDYTKAAILEWPDGNWKYPEPGVS